MSVVQEGQLAVLANPDPIGELFLRAYGRPATVPEIEKVADYAREHGLANACRVILNSSEFLYVH